MRIFTIGFLWVAICIGSQTAGAGDQLAKVTVAGRVVYIVPKEYTEKPDSMVRYHFGGELTQEQHDHLTFWTPSAMEAREAEAAVTSFIRAGATDPKSAFPDIVAHPEQSIPSALHMAGDEIQMVKRDYEKYARQFVGISFGQDRLIYCSHVFAESAKLFGKDVSRSFVSISDGGHTIWQLEYDMNTRRCLNLQINGPWLDEISPPPIPSIPSPNSVNSVKNSAGLTR